MGLKLRRAERLDSALARAPDSRVARRGVVDRRQAHLQDRLTLTTHRRSTYDSRAHRSARRHTAYHTVMLLKAL